MLRFASGSSERDVLVTGVGAVTPAGLTAADTFRFVQRGGVSARSLTSSDIDHWSGLGQVAGLQRSGCVVDHRQVAAWLGSSVLSGRIQQAGLQDVLSEPMIAMALLAFAEAWRTAGFSSDVMAGESDPDRTAVVFGSSKGGLRTAERLVALERSIGANARVSLPATVCAGGTPALLAESAGVRPACVSSAALADVAEPEPDPALAARIWRRQAGTDAATTAIAGLLQAEAGVMCPVAACATGLIAVLQGAALIASGQCDVCVVGSSDAALRASVLSSFHRLGVLSRRGPAELACCPFDIHRGGFVVGEGAGVLILESRRNAKRRGVAGLCRVLGGGWLSDPTGLTQMDESGEVVREVLRRCCEANGVQPGILGLHGTATETNDLVEARGVSAAGLADVSECYAVKGSVGHLLGAAGSVETILTVQGIAAGQRPGTVNLSQQDQRCHLRIARHSAAVSQREVWGKLSLGFGGHVACGLFVAD